MCGRISEIEAKMLLKCQNNEFHRSWQRGKYSCRFRGQNKAHEKCFHIQNELNAYLKPFRWYTQKSVHPSDNHVPHYSLNTSPNRTSRSLKWSGSQVDSIDIWTQKVDSKFEWKCENAPSHSAEKRQRDRAQPQTRSFIYFSKLQVPFRPG